MLSIRATETQPHPRAILGTVYIVFVYIYIVISSCCVTSISECDEYKLENIKLIQISCALGCNYAIRVDFEAFDIGAHRQLWYIVSLLYLSYVYIYL